MICTPALTRCETLIVDTLYGHQGQTFSYSELSTAVFGYANSGRALNTHVARIRRKLGPDSITTVWGSGFAAGVMHRCPTCQGSGWL